MTSPRSSNNTYLSFDVDRADGKRVVMQLRRYNKKRHVTRGTARKK